MTVALVVAFAYGASPLLGAPDAKGIGAPADEFSAARAMVHVGEIASAPHPAGSASMAGVAEYLATALEDLGIEVDRQNVGNLHNVAARIPGTASTGAVLFVSHPDSVAEGPGAGDNATGAAALVEMARVLVAGEQLRNDVIVLLDDGEEQGFRGGEAFAASHPWMADVKVAVGLDTAAWGPPYVTQVANDYGVIVEAYAAGVDDPLAYGFLATEDSSAEYETTPFRTRDIPSMEIEDTHANVDQHTAHDTADGVDARRVQQLGDQSLALARALGKTDLTDASAPGRVFHTVPGVGVVHYPVAWDSVLVGLVLVGFIALVIIGVRRGQLRARRVAVGAGAALSLVVATALVAFVAASIYDAWRPNPNPLLDEYLLPSSAPYVIVAWTVIAALFGLGYWRLARRIGGPELAVGFLAVASIVSLLLVTALPGTVYVVAWPLLAAVCLWLWLLLQPDVPGLVLVVPAVLVTAVAAPLMLTGYFSAGIAELPVPALFNALAAGALIVPAFHVNPRELSATLRT